MTHLPFIIASYGLSVLVVAALALNAARRASRARAKLASLDARAQEKRAAR